MRTVHGVKNLGQPLARSVVTIGNFDGLHLGHRKIITRLKEWAHECGGQTVVVTFDPHPRQVLFPEQKFKRLFSRADLESQLSSLGVDYLVLEPFSRQLSQLDPVQFIQEHVVKPFSPHGLVVGYDFSFGADRKGTLAVLEKIVRDLQVGLEIVPPYKVEGQIISSTRIRNAVQEGNVELAHLMLGRNFFVEGIVERGEGRGHKLGFPTANIHSSAETLPKNGVYAGWLHFRGSRLQAVTNVGVNPTFHSGNGHSIKIEAHVLDFTGDLYGETLNFEFAKRLRDERKFASVEELVEQIKLDCQMARQVLR